MGRLIRKNLTPFLAVLGLAAIALAVAGVILVGQDKIVFPWDEQPVRMTAVLDNAQSVTPGQGQGVQVAGVEIGKIVDVELEDGRAKLGLDIDKEYVDEGLIRQDASALLRPRTPLKDMYVQLLPGSRQQPAAGKGFSIPISRTMSDVDLEEILAELDTRTRDYLTLLVNGTGKGLKGRGADLAEVFRRYQPTARDLARVNRAVGQERVALRRLVSSLGELNTRLARKPEDLSQLVTSANATFAAFSSEDDRLRDTVSQLPRTLRQATTTLRDVRPLADELGPATQALVPAMRALASANREIRPAARQTLAPVRDQIRPFVRQARPVVQDLAPAAEDLSKTFPELVRASNVLNRFFNMLAFNKGGREQPGAAGRDEGYLYWLSWTAHNAANLINVDDGNGPMRPIFLTGACGTLQTLVNDTPALEFAQGLSGLLATVCGDPDTASISKSRALRKAGFVKGDAAKKGGEGQ
ncbi:MlaD family protein [Conexibacter sp. SYSU D00693]|uniref:MlaD family protein n=1 Tax=Conexibacter sp. SYSU D00693 TaxID=2812560 RepID=UPI00196AA0CC|nr:MlaD family protein [Conexibacter sp. SYSU D00693]